jgi:type IV secretory pathway protease TraF
MTRAQAGEGIAAADGRERRPAAIPLQLRAFLATGAVVAAAFDLARAWRAARRGPWRVEIAERSMVPAVNPGDWLLVDPTVDCWPRRGALVLVREPDSEILVLKRVTARPGDVVVTAGGRQALGPWDAWISGDAGDVSIDSRRYGPVPLERLVARAWFRYGPVGRMGRLDTRPRR